MTSAFWAEQEEQSRVKSEIVVDYFVAWATILSNQADTITYLDPFCGPGRFKDGAPSTPLLVVEAASKTPRVAAALQTQFSDADPSAVESLTRHLRELPATRALRHAPQIGQAEVDNRLADFLRARPKEPTLTFLDPWGYKGVTLDRTDRPVRLIPFRFSRNGARTSHYICFATRSDVGYRIMKGVMAKRGMTDEDGVPTFEYFPEVAGRQLQLGSGRPLQSLPRLLLEAFTGRTLRVRELINEHQATGPFLDPHYKQSLLALEANGQVICDPAKRKARTMADHVLVRFP